MHRLPLYRDLLHPGIMMKTQQIIFTVCESRHLRFRVGGRGADAQIRLKMDFPSPTAAIPKGPRSIGFATS